jgi:S-methylmethionine-dependent homocysteine/selenocysteine methylase
MARYRSALPQLSGQFFLTDGGIETTLIFHNGLDLPDFAAFHLLKDAEGEAALNKYFRSYTDIARRYKAGLILESVTWRASPDWGARLGYSRDDLAEVNRKSIRQLEAIRDQDEQDSTPIVISGCIGPRGDGYNPDVISSAQEAEAYHQMQAEVFADTAADLISALTMNYVDEAIGVARAAQHVGMPVVISFTVETDGKLPTGDTLESAIDQVDQATGGYPIYYMINCAHPTHFDHVLTDESNSLKRIQGLRANASRKSHAELNESSTLDDGDPVELASQYLDLKRRLNKLNVMGGCCGTDHRHIEQIARSVAPYFRLVN